MKMRKIYYADIKFLFLPTSFLFILIFINSTASGQNIPTDKVSLAKGEQLFLHNCFPCHETGKEVIGPALVNIPEKRPVNWLLRFIKNSQQLIIENDSIAAFLYEQYNHNTMPAFYKFSDEDILAILGYINKKSLTEFKEDIQHKDEPGIILQGKQLFSDNCSHCHAIGHQIIGPGLASIPKTRTKAWLMDFIKNSQGVIKSGEPHANFLYEKFNNTKMPSFSFLPDENIEAILLYIQNESESPNYIAGVNGQHILSEDKSKVTDFKILKPSSPAEEPKSLSKAAMILVTMLIIVMKAVVGVRVFKNLNKR
jgi:mono/diheme cytochrome c family protein